MICVRVIDQCANVRCPIGEHCVTVDDLNATATTVCVSDLCPSNSSNCTQQIDQGASSTDSDEVDPEWSDPCSEWDPCRYEGTCYRGPDGQSACKCRFNFEGKHCSPVDMCAKFR